ncbi:MAG: S8 family serine peptidase [Anaerolineales bacterium]
MTPSDPKQSGCASPVVFVVTLLWVLSVTFVRLSVGYTLSAAPSLSTNGTIILLSLGQAIFIGLPLLALARAWRDLRYRGIYRTWTLAVAFILVMLPVQLTNPDHTQLQAVLHILAAWIYIAVLRFTGGGRTQPAEDGSSEPRLAAKSNANALFVAILIAAVMAYPWLAWGALGSALDTLLQLLAAASFGIAGGLLIQRFLFSTQDLFPLESGRDYFLAGLAAGTALLLVASGTAFAFSGMQILLGLVLSASGWTLVGIHQLGKAAPVKDEPGQPVTESASLPIYLLIAGAAAAPMAMIDPDELALILNATPGELIQWASYAAGIGVLLAWLAGLVLLFIIRRQQRAQNSLDAQIKPAERTRPALQALALAAVVGGALIYAFAGRPGFFGERLFVILNTQADLSSASQITDYTNRREQVYTVLVEHAERTQASLRQALQSYHIHYTPYYLENALEVNADSLLMLWLNRLPEVERVLYSPHMRPLPEKPPVLPGSAGPPTGPQWNLQALQVERVWNELGITGEGILVGQSDSGAQYDHPELAASFRGKDGQFDYNWYDPWYHTRIPEDLGGHGTHTLGIILGKNTGVAPDASWYACVNLARNLGNPALYLDCMQFMLAPFPLGGDPFHEGKPELGAQVSNNSWGCPPLEGCDPQALLPAAQALRAAGIFLAVSAGNDGPACATVDSPLALYQAVFSVGASDQGGNVASFSSRGPVTVDGSGRIKPDILAPGVNILSAAPENSYAIFSGTSMSGPHVAGVVALMWSANPDLIGDIQRTEEILEQSAQAYTGSVPNCPEASQTPSTVYGYGMLDAYQAVQGALQAAK